MEIGEAIRRYLIWREGMGAARGTLDAFSSVFKVFRLWADGEGVTTIEQLTSEVLNLYQQALCFHLNRQGRPISVRTQFKHLVTLKRWGRYLVEQDFLISDPTRILKLPRCPQLLPRMVPDVDQAVRLMRTSFGKGLEVYRNRAILELLYGAGLRRSEVANLNIGDLDLVGGYCWIRRGKGGKDRVAPLGQMGIRAIEIYLDAVRPGLVKERDLEALFLNDRGERLAEHGVYYIVRRAVAKARLSGKITPHALRHAAATHMLQNGAPIRHLQEFLGHASLATTQVYTRITIPELKAIHAKYHPREIRGTDYGLKKAYLLPLT